MFERPSENLLFKAEKKNFFISSLILALYGINLYFYNRRFILYSGSFWHNINKEQQLKTLKFKSIINNFIDDYQFSDRNRVNYFNSFKFY